MPAGTDENADRSAAEAEAGGGSEGQSDTGTDSGLGGSGEKDDSVDTSDKTEPDDELPGGNDGEQEGEDGPAAALGEKRTSQKAIH